MSGATMGDPVLFRDGAGEFRLSDLVKVVKTWTTDPQRQRQLVEAYLAGLAKVERRGTCGF